MEHIMGQRVGRWRSCEDEADIRVSVYDEFNEV